MAPPSKLAIATSSLQRLLKEEASYHKELQQQEARIARLDPASTDENAEYIKKQEERALEETKAVFPPLKKRIQQAVESLEQQLASSEGSASEEDVTKAKEALAPFFQIWV